MSLLTSQGKPFEISKWEVWEAYQQVKDNQGAAGVDGVSLEVFEADLKNNLYRVWNRMSSGTWFPPAVRAVEIPKPHGGGTRMLGIPCVADRVAQTVVARRLNAVVERVFHDDSFGYRPGRSALDAVRRCRERCWRRDWVIDLDVAAFFDSVPWEFIVKAVQAHTDLPWVVLYVQRWLAAAIQTPDGSLVERDRGTPQGSPLSPVLSNIYLDRLDNFIEQTLLPAYNRGARRTPYRPYMRLWQRAWRLEQQGEREAGHLLRKQMKTMPSRDPHDPGYRRLRYCRYADDWLLSFTGPRREAEQIKAGIGAFLREQLTLELSPTKTLITHGRTHAARFLGYEIVVLHADDKRDHRDHRGHRSINAAIGLKVPADVIRAKCSPYLHHGRPIRRTERTVDTDFSIVAQFQAEFRGVAQYYKLAFNRHRLGRLKRVMEQSLTKTLARKYRIRVPQVYRRYRAVLATEHGPRRGLRVTVDRDGGRAPLVAQWGGISLARDTTPTVLNDDPPRVWSNRRSELVQRLLADTCELCGSGNQVEVHHVRALKDLNPRGRKQQPEWATRMASRRRKTLLVCRACHEGIHYGGRPTRQPR